MGSGVDKNDLAASAYEWLVEGASFEAVVRESTGDSTSFPRTRT